MTAHVMNGDRERFLAAGMDGYVSKPIHARQLVAAIEAAVAPPGGDSFPEQVAGWRVWMRPWLSSTDPTERPLREAEETAKRWLPRRFWTHTARS
jgi:DNA-binding NarL/FixJ family response regulator